jgi:hypothetical protein
MKQESINTKNLYSLGLNLIAATEVSKLPPDLINFFSKKNISFQLTDTLCLIASGGKELWEHLPHPLNEFDHPIDQFSIDQMKKIQVEQKIDVRILFPHPFLHIPLQKIGRFLNLSRPSFLGLDINDNYGAWFAFRGAFLTTKKLNLPSLLSFESPCDACTDRPCVNACPSKAIASKDELKMNLCIDYRLNPNSNCSDKCHARLACPYQKEHQYKMEQINYHMTTKAHLKKLSMHKID